MQILVKQPLFHTLSLSLSLSIVSAYRDYSVVKLFTSRATPISTTPAFVTPFKLSTVPPLPLD